MPDINSSPSKLENRALQVADLCACVGKELAHRGKRAATAKRLIRGINVVIGILAVCATFIEPIASRLGPDGLKWVAVVVAIVLILDGVLPVVLGNIMPVRFRDYSTYILYYSERIRDTLADDGLPDSERRARVVALIDLATKNVADVTAQWPEITTSV